MAGQVIGMTSTLERDLLTGVKTRFNQSFNVAAAKHGQWREICTVVPSTAKTENMPFFNPLGDMEDWNDERQVEFLETNQWSLTNKDFEKTIGIDRNTLEDEQLGMIGPRIDELGLVAARYYNTEVALLLNNHIADTETRFPGSVAVDGKPLFAIDHTWTVGSYTTSQDNVRGVSTANQGKMDATYGLANLQGAYDSIVGFKNAKGNRIGSIPDTLMVSQSVSWAAKQILNSSELNLAVPGTDAPADVVYERGTRNPIYDNNIRLIINPELTSGYWILYDSTAPIRPVWFQDRQRPRFGQLTDATGSERAFMSKHFLYGVDCRFALAPGAWWTCVAGDGT